MSKGSVEVGQGYCNVDGVNKIIFSNSVKKDFEDIGGTKGFKNNVVVTLDNSDVSSFILQGVEAGEPTGYKATKALDKFVYLNNNKDMILGDSPKEGLDVSLPLDINPVGDLKISGGVASNFSTTNYINTGKIFNFHDSDSWEIGYTIIPKTVSKDQWIFGAASFVQDVIFPLGFISRGKFQLLASYAGTSWDVAGTGSHSVQANTKYWIRYGFNGSYYYFKYSLDGINFIEDIRVSSSTRVVANTSVVVGIGRNAFSSDPDPWINNFFDGSIDLKETYVRIGTNVWTPLVKSAIDVSKGYAYSDEITGNLEVSNETEYTLQEILVHPEDFNNTELPMFSVLGNVSINNKVANNFSSSSYIRASTKVDYTSFTMVSKIYVPSASLGTYIQIGGWHVARFSYNKYVVWNSEETSLSGVSVSIGRWAWCKVVYSEENIKIYYLVDNGYSIETLPENGWTLIHESTKRLGDVKTTEITMGTDAGYTPNYCKGSIDLGNTAILVNEVIVWKPYMVFKEGYLSLANPSGTTKVIATGMRNPTKDYAESVVTPIDLAKKIALSEDLSEIISVEDI